MSQLDHLPELAREIVDIIEIDGLMRLVNSVGGLQLRSRSELIKQALTKQQYKAFIDYFGNSVITIPKLKAKQHQLEVAETQRLIEQGKLKREVAKQQNITERAVYQRLQKARKTEDNQQELF
jgi:DNA invertase Pin-like site-specific DNA recombinase